MLKEYRKIFTLAGNQKPAVQLIARRSNDWAIPSLISLRYILISSLCVPSGLIPITCYITWLRKCKVATATIPRHVKYNSEKHEVVCLNILDPFPFQSHFKQQQKREFIFAPPLPLSALSDIQRSSGSPCSVASSGTGPTNIFLQNFSFYNVSWPISNLIVH